MGVKYIVVTGGVLSGLGKGIATASIGHLLSYDYNVIPIKCDGYLNVDPGTMNPIEHGEVFVLDDGTEVDMDFGHYERFLNTVCTGKQNLTMGKVFQEIRQLERKGAFLGKTVQFIPHVAEHIKNWWTTLAKKREADIVTVEIGGTVGDIENELYLEAARRLRMELGPDNVMFVHLTYVPVPSGVNEQKSKPTQQSASLLMQRGILPDIILCRSPERISEPIKKKISGFCNVSMDAVISAVDVNSVYKIPLLFNEQGITEVINKKLGLNAKPKLDAWRNTIEKMSAANKNINIAICGKYTALEDSYASVVEALNHAAMYSGAVINVKWIDTENLEKNEQDVEKFLSDVNGVIVPGGFGSRGAEGKINVIKYCRENNVPYLGICYGLQLAVIEFLRNVCNKESANSTEIDAKTMYPVIDILPDKKNLENLGGTLRLGAYEAILEKDSLARALYSSDRAEERHRHRYEVNPIYHDELRANGLKLSGMSHDNVLVEYIEYENHPFFIATQSHPELKSSPLKPAPLFLGLVNAALKR